MDATDLDRGAIQKEAAEKIPPLALWAKNAKFKIGHEYSWEACIDDQMEIMLQDLLSQDGIKNMVADKLTRYFIIRVFGPIPAYFAASLGPAYVYPLRIHDQKIPTIAEIPLKVGEYIQIRSSKFLVTPGVDCLIVLTVSAESRSAVGGQASIKPEEPTSASSPPPVPPPQPAATTVDQGGLLAEIRNLRKLADDLEKRVTGQTTTTDTASITSLPE